MRRSAGASRDHGSFHGPWFGYGIERGQVRTRDAAERAGVEPSYLDRLVDLGILAPEEPDRFSGGDVRRAG